MKSIRGVVYGIVLLSLLAACSGTPAAGAQPPAGAPAGTGDLTRTDEQGAVVVEITPADLVAQGETLDFKVAMNTHSVELGMDLTALATLTTDSGRTAPAPSWDGSRGGHHVSGTLSFPARVDGKALLDGATTITLTLKDVDAPERTFTWKLSK
jgi:hypothetical protein